MEKRMLKNKKKLHYKTYDYTVVQPKSNKVKVVTVNYLEDKPEDKETPLFKVSLPTEKGFFKGIEYTEQSVLLGYSDARWKKLRSIQFDQSANKVFDIDQVNLVNKLSRNDIILKDAILSSFV